MKPITDKAEISIEFPDKAYVGAFGHNSTFDAQSDAEGIKVKLSRPGADHRTAEVFLHYYLFADILTELAQSIAEHPPLDDAHRSDLLEAVRALERALG
jgi:hypothetical protein